MFKHSAIVILLILIITLFGCTRADVLDNRWKIYFTDEYRNCYYYDSKSLTHVSKNIIRVWDKKILTEETVKKINKRFSEFAEKGFIAPRVDTEIIMLFEIDCPKKMARVIEQPPLVNKEFEVPSNWSSIPPESPIEYLYEILCGK